MIAMSLTKQLVRAIVLSALIVCSNSAMNAQDAEPSISEELNIKWVSPKEPNSPLQFSISLLIAANDSKLNRNTITILKSLGDHDLDRKAVGMVNRFVKAAIFDKKNRPLGLYKSGHQDIYFGAVAKLVVIDGSSQMLVLDLNRFGPSGFVRAGISGVYFFVDGKIASVVRVPSSFIFHD